MSVWGKKIDRNFDDQLQTDKQKKKVTRKLVVVYNQQNNGTPKKKTSAEKWCSRKTKKKITITIKAKKKIWW